MLLENPPPLTNALVTSLIEHFVIAVMQDDALKALISDLGEGIVIDPELLEGCSVAAHDLDDEVDVVVASSRPDVCLAVFESRLPLPAIWPARLLSSWHPRPRSRTLF